MTHDITTGLYLRNIEEYLTVAGCVRMFENIWFDVDKTVEALSRETIDENSPLYWVKGENINYIEIKDDYENFGNFFYKKFYNDIVQTTFSSVNKYFTDYNIKDPIFASNICLTKIKPKADFESDITMKGKLTALIFLNKECEETVIEFPYFGLKLNPSYGGMMFIPSAFPYRCTIKTNNNPLCFFQATVN